MEFNIEDYNNFHRATKEEELQQRTRQYKTDKVCILMKDLLQDLLVDRSCKKTLTKEDEKKTEEINILLNELEFTDIFPYF